MKRAKKYLVISIPLIIGVLINLVLHTACTKTDIAVNKFSKKGTWTAESITDGSSTIFSLPKWKVSKCKQEDDSFCTGTWEHPAGSVAEFKYRFGFSGSFIEIYPVNEDPPAEQEQSQAWHQCHNLSGKYDVIEQKRNLFDIQSEETYGYPGKMVRIVLK